MDPFLRLEQTMEYEVFLQFDYQGRAGFRSLLFGKQKGQCCLCQFSLGDSRNGVVHHNHQTGKIVGLVHASCNTKEGMGIYIKTNPLERP